MFALVNLDAEVIRVEEILFNGPWKFGRIIREDFLCKFYLYHYLVGESGTFTQAPILHVPHDRIPLLPNEWSNRLHSLMSMNHGTLYMVTDGRFRIPLGSSWVRRGQRRGLLFRDTDLEFYCTRYRYNDEYRPSRIFLDVFKAVPIPNKVPTRDFNLNFRIMKMHKPYFKNYRGKYGRGISVKTLVGPYVPDYALPN